MGRAAGDEQLRALQDQCAVRLPLGTAVRQEQVQSAGSPTRLLVEPVSVAAPVVQGHFCYDFYIPAFTHDVAGFFVADKPTLTVGTCGLALR